MKTISLIAAACLLVLSTSCGEDRVTGVPEGVGEVLIDAGPGTSGAVDAGGDAGAPDAGRLDAGLPDAGRLDAGLPDAGPAVELPVLFDLYGVWTVEGSDARGAYRGEAELRPADGGVLFVRTIRYPGVTVEGDRELWWAWEGAARELQGVELQVTLATRDFIAQRGPMVRSRTEPPVQVTGRVTVVNRVVSVSYQGTGIAQAETWTQRRLSGPAPLFTSERAWAPTHDAPSSSAKDAYFLLYDSFHQLPEVQPYVHRPEFKAAVHGAWVDKTDFAFYRAHPAALRVVNKVIDPISQLETLQRANAYRWTLAQKATHFADDVWTRFIAPSGVNMVPDSRTATGAIVESTDSALWTGTWVAAEAFRYMVTGDVVARQRVALGVEALITLQEITGDWTTFARVLRPARPTPPAPPWHAGTGAFAHLEWKEGGNNDMMKGLQYGYLLGFQALCTTGGTTSAALCDRLRNAAKHLAEDAQVSQGTNSSTNYWLAAYVSNDLVEKAQLLARAELEWDAFQAIESVHVPHSADGVADWSGLHLHFVGRVTKMLLSRVMPLNSGTSTDALRQYIARDHDELRRNRLVLMHLLRGAFDPTGATTEDLEDLRWRLREYRFPKIAWAVDHTLRPDFCLSPYPALPWKNDWTTNDRFQALDWYPLFESQADVYLWKVGRDYQDNGSQAEAPTVDFLHAYWFGRALGVLSATE